MHDETIGRFCSWYFTVVLSSPVTAALLLHGPKTTPNPEKLGPKLQRKLFGDAATAQPIPCYCIALLLSLINLIIIIPCSRKHPPTQSAPGCPFHHCAIFNLIPCNISNTFALCCSQRSLPLQHALSCLLASDIKSYCIIATWRRPLLKARLSPHHSYLQRLHRGL
jgi:hypothetical protein